MTYEDSIKRKKLKNNKDEYIARSKDTFKKYDKYLYSSIFDAVFTKYVKQYDFYSGLNDRLFYEVLAKMTVEKHLCNKINTSNDIDLMILFIEDYIETARYLLKRYGLDENEAESIVISAIENYNPDIFLTSNIYREVKNKIKKKY